MLHVQNLAKQFQMHTAGGKTIHGFSNVSFAIETGRALALSGPSGSGKSSVLKCIYGTYLASSGSIVYESSKLGCVDLTKLCEHDILLLRERELGYVTQFLKVLPRVPAIDVVAEPIAADVGWQEARERALDLLNRLHIPASLLDAYPNTFSGGEQQRVNIAKAVISRPKLLLLDEPTASLDSLSVGIVKDLLEELRAEGTTMVMIFHDRTIMSELADDIYCMPEREEVMNGVLA